MSAVLKELAPVEVRIGTHKDNGMGMTTRICEVTFDDDNATLNVFVGGNYRYFEVRGTRADGVEMSVQMSIHDMISEAVFLLHEEIKRCESEAAIGGDA